MDRTSYIGNLATKVAIGTALLFSAPSTNANGGSGYVEAERSNDVSYEIQRINERLNSIESKMQQRNYNQNIANALLGLGVCLGVINTWIKTKKRN